LQAKLFAILQQEAVEKDEEIQRLRIQRESDVDEKAQLSQKLNDAIATISTLQRERNLKLDAHVTNQAADEIQRAGKHPITQG